MRGRQGIVMNDAKENVDREELYRLVWTEPISKLAASFGVSGSYLARMCRELAVPTPPRGYWAQLTAGKNPKKEPLPAHIPGTPSVWMRSYASAIPTDIHPVPPQPRETIPPKRSNATTLGFLENTREIFAKAKTSYSSVHLSPRHRNLVDILTTQENLDRSITFAKKLFSRLNDYGYRVVLSNHQDGFEKVSIDEEEVPRDKRKDLYITYPWRPHPCTVAYLGSVAIGLSIVEITEKVKPTGWYGEKAVGTGRHRLYAYSPYRHTNLIRTWQDTRERTLSSRFDEIILEMEKMARDIPSLIIEGEKKAKAELEQREAERLAYRKKMAEEARLQAKTKSRDALKELIDAWATFKGQLEFLEELSASIEDLPPEIREPLLTRLAEAKSLLEGASVIDIIQAWKTPEERYAALPSWQRYDED